MKNSENKYIAFWLKSAENDLETMQYLCEGRRYVHALFFGHLYIEKLSKALWIKNKEENYPPKIHNILSILKHTDINLDEAQMLFLLKLNQYQIEGRYPEDIEKLYKITDKKLTLEYLTTIKTIALCLQSKLQ